MEISMRKTQQERTQWNNEFWIELKIVADLLIIQNMNDTPVYTSKRTAKSLWQQYRIYRDRLELQSWLLFHTIVVPANEIQAVEVRPPGLIWGVKLDSCNFCRHVLLIKKSGLLFTKRIGFTPDDPEKFVEICKSILPSG